MFKNFQYEEFKKFKEIPKISLNSNNACTEECEANLSSEDDFRGFQKVPIVLCERIDINSYLNVRSKEEKNKIPKNFVNSKCTVKLIRTDLNHLRQLFLKKSKKVQNLARIGFGTILKCNICEKVYTSEKRLLKHQENKHMLVIKSQPCKTLKRVSFSDNIIVHEVKEYHKCRKCSKIFEDYKSLKTHMKQVHKKRKCYICFYCSRKFIDRMFFKVHIKLHCSLCGVFFSNKLQYNEHRHTVCKNFKKYICKNCKYVFFSFMARKDHSYQHEGYFFVCDICKERFSNKCFLSHHIHFLHLKNHHKSMYITTNDDEEIYKCNFCEAQYVDEKYIKEHIKNLPNLDNRKTKGYKDYFFCDQCSEEFAIETDMLQHKWIHFLKTNPREKQIPTLKHSYRIDDELPKFLQPKLILHKIDETGTSIIPKNQKTTVLHEQTILPMIKNNNLSKMPIFHPKMKRKIMFSQHQCEKCGKYFSTNYCLKRHMQMIHYNKEMDKLASLQCDKCEEVFVWPSLLESHNCIRMTTPELPFNDSEAEIMIEDMYKYPQNGFNVPDSAIGVEHVNDIDIPAPIVQLTEYNDYNIIVNCNSGNVDLVNNEKTDNMQDLSAQLIIIQEVPIEF